MPQLHPSPWFTTLLIAWVLLLVLVKPMLMHPPHTTPTTPKPAADTQNNWSWPWP